jgi:hypothetical protein
VRTPVCGLSVKSGQRRHPPLSEKAAAFARARPPSTAPPGLAEALACQSWPGGRSLFQGGGRLEQLGACGPFELGWFGQGSAMGVAGAGHLVAGCPARRRPDPRGRALGQVGVCDRVRGDPHLLLLGFGADLIRAARSAVGRSRPTIPSGDSHVIEAEHNRPLPLRRRRLSCDGRAEVDREPPLRERPARARRAAHHPRHSRARRMPCRSHQGVSHRSDLGVLRPLAPAATCPSNPLAGALGRP